MPSTDPKIGHYVDALLGLAEASGSPAAIEEDLMALIDLLETNEDLRRFLADPVVHHKGKKQTLEELLSGSLHPVVRHFTLILHEAGDLGRLRELADGFFSRLSAGRNRVTGVLLTAVPLPEDKVAVIEEETGRLLGKVVHLRVRVDAGILGGMRVQVGDFVLDGTVERQFDRIRKDLLI